MLKLPDFIIIPYQLLEDNKISLVDERLYGIIYWLTKLKNEKCMASNKTLSELIKSTTGTVQNSLTKLEELGYIKRTFKDISKRVRKEIIPLVVFSKVSFISDTSNKVSPSNDTVSPTDDTHVSPTSEQNKNIHNNKRKEDNATETVAPFFFKDYLKELEEDKRRHINVIGHYFEVKGLRFDTREQANSALKRHLRASVEVAKFSDREIVKATEQARQEYKDLYTIETIHKILTR